MKKLNVLCVMLAVLVAGLSVAEEDAAASITGDENNPLNAVVKLEVSTTKPDFCRPWGNRTDSVTGSGVVIGKERILTCAHCVTDACYIRVRKHNVDRLYHGSVLFVNDSPGRLLEEAGRFLSEGVDNDADLAHVCVDDPAFMAGITPMEIGETPHVQDDVLAVNRGGSARCPQVRQNSRFA